MGVALLAGPANVIMELAQPGVGYGVLESRVESGRMDRHPIKRARTTFTYLAVATAGSDAQKKAFRHGVNRAHAQVYSTPDSPVRYNAFDLDLQLWVGACLYKGGLDIHRIFIGELDDEDADRHYHEGMALATTLQVPPEMWPRGPGGLRPILAGVAGQGAHRRHCPGISLSDRGGADAWGAASGAAAALVGRAFSLLITTGFLPQQFRDQMRLPWDADRQRRFDRLMAVLRTANRLMPRFVRRFPFNVLLWDVDRRIRTGRPLV